MIMNILTILLIKILTSLLHQKNYALIWLLIILRLDIVISLTNWVVVILYLNDILLSINMVNLLQRRLIMPTNKKRLMIVLDDDMLFKIETLKSKLNTKQLSKVLKEAINYLYDKESM